MARTSYLARRDGRYFMQARFAVQCAPLVGKPLYRAALGTSEYRSARRRLAECLNWFLVMNESVDFPSLFEKNVTQLRTYLQDSWPISEDRLHARIRYEELLKNLRRRAEAAGWPADIIEPEFFDLLKTFVEQNVTAQEHHQRAGRIREYERGRADMAAAFEAGAVPAPFTNSSPTPLSTVDDTPPVRMKAPEAVSPPTPPPAAVEVDAGRQQMTFSSALTEYVREMRQEERSADGIRDVELVVQFLIDQFGDLIVDTFDGEKPKQLDRMLPDIPDRNNIPRDRCTSLSARYLYAKEHGWKDLKRLTEARLRNGYHNSLSKFFGWLIRKGYYPHTKPIFNKVSGKNLASLPRDAFESEEIIKLFSQPLFVGCESPKRIWKPGAVFVQSHLYWGYIILILHGFRISEVGQMETGDVVRRNGVYYFDLRGFDPEEGRPAIEDLKRFKTSGSERLVPIHPLVIELGLLDRIRELKERNCRALFPEWEPYIKPNGEPRWGQPITKSWQYLKKQLGFTRADVTAYSTRHTYAQYLDSTAVSHRARMQAMGHSSKKDIPAGYGSKKRYSTRDLDEIMSISAPEIQFMTERLVQAKREADAGKLIVVKPWLHRANWSKHYQEKFG